MQVKLPPRSLAGKVLSFIPEPRIPRSTRDGSPPPATGKMRSGDPAVIEFLKGRARGAYAIVDKHLVGRGFLLGERPTIADISIIGWVRNLVGFYGARDLVAFDALKHVPAWLERGLARPAVQRGLAIPQRA